MKFPAYLEYKASGIDWLAKIPKHWKLKKLKFLLAKALQYGANESAELDDPLLPRYVRITDIDETGNLRDDTFRSLPKDIALPYLLDEGDLLFARSGATSGKTFLYRKSWGICAYAGYLIRARFEASKAFPRYVKYFTATSHYWQWLSSIYIQATIQNVSAEKYGDLFLTMPPLSEQRAIADFLDGETAKLDTLAAKRRELIEKLKEKRSALISRTVTRGLPPEAARAAGLDPNPKLKPSGIEWLGEIPEHWRVTRLKYATSRIIDCPHETPIYSSDGDYLVVRTADLTLGVMNLSNAYRLDEDEYRKRTRREPVLQGDIVYGREGERWGFAALAPPSPTVCLGQRMMQFRAGNHWDNTFLMWELNSKAVYQQGAVDTLGATSPHVNVETIRNYWLTEPPAVEQRMIADYLDRETNKIDRMVAKVEEAIERLQEYRTALITAAVTGKIDVRNVRHSGENPNPGDADGDGYRHPPV